MEVYDKFYEEYSKIERSIGTKTTIRTAAKNVSLVGGQGFTFCNCKTGCKGNRCKCAKNGLKCNSRCHDKLTCDNKFE